MSPPNAIYASDPEDEVRNLLPNTVIEFEGEPLVDAEEEFEENPSEDEPMEEDPSEEEPFEEEPSEEEPFEEESNEAPPSPVTSSDPPPSPRTYREYPDGPLLTYPPGRDPYLPPSPTTLPPRYRWAWIRRIIGLWRHDEGDRIPEVVDSPAMAPVCPVTGEPTHLTIPLMIARLFRHESRLQELQDASRAIPSPDSTLQIHRELQSLRSDHRGLRNNHEHLERETNDDIVAHARWILRNEEELGELRTMVRELNLRVRELEEARPQDRDQ